MIALETLQVANARRARDALRSIIESSQRLAAQIREMVRVTVLTIRQIADAFHVPVELLYARPYGQPYYWRDGKRRRNHAWFRERARIRRRIDRAARAPW